jgi:hypothetical protein
MRAPALQFHPLAVARLPTILRIWCSMKLWPSTTRRTQGAPPMSMVPGHSNERMKRLASCRCASTLTWGAGGGGWRGLRGGGRGAAPQRSGAARKCVGAAGAA